MLQVADGHAAYVQLVAKQQTYRLASLRCTADAISARMQQQQQGSLPSSAPASGAATPVSARCDTCMQHVATLSPLCGPCYCLNVLQSWRCMVGLQVLHGQATHTMLDHCLCRGGLPSASRGQDPAVLDAKSKFMDAASEAMEPLLDDVPGDEMRVVQQYMQHVERLVGLYDSLEQEGLLPYIPLSAAAGDASMQSAIGSQLQCADVPVVPEDLRSSAARVSQEMTSCRASLQQLERACAMAVRLRNTFAQLADAHGLLCDLYCEPAVLQPYVRAIAAGGAEELTTTNDVTAVLQHVNQLEAHIVIAKDMLDVHIQAAEYDAAALQIEHGMSCMLGEFYVQFAAACQRLGRECCAYCFA